MKTKFLILLGLIILYSSFILSAQAQPAAFTYAGRLNNNNSVANGWYDLQFALFDAAAAGNPIGSALTTNAVAVSNGLFTVTLDFGAGMFPGADRWLNLSVKTNGAASFSPLAPRQQIMSTPYAITAGNVTGPINGGAIINGSIAGTKLANGAVGASQLASNSITANQLAPGAAAANLGTNSPGGIPSGGLVLSATKNNAALVNAGYVRIGDMMTTTDPWQQRDNGFSPTARFSHTAVWTGSEMITWGGYGSGYLNDGARYNPVGNNWTAMSIIGAPAARTQNTVVWTGSEMIVWGGTAGSSTHFNDGGRYDPAADTWAAVTATGAPTAREGHTAVWTGSEMIVWGGDSGFSYFSDGGRYNPAGNSWTSVTNVGAPATRSFHTAVWTGSEMIIWGGFGGSFTALNDGGRYHPLDNTWTLILNSLPNTPAARTQHTAVWTGSEMIVWGGSDGNTGLGDGGRYNPTGNNWAAVSNLGAPAARTQHTMVWTGSELIIWGGFDPTSFTYLNDGGRYNPAGNSWTLTQTIGSPTLRGRHTAVWTGSEMIVWGGSVGVGLNTGGRFNPADNSWTAVPISAAPTGRRNHTAVWTGSEMIVWGGYNNPNPYFNTGGRYNPVGNNWTAVTTSGAPTVRAYHTAVWTGSEMIVWGGSSTDGLVSVGLSDGGRYNPVENSWKVVAAGGAPSGRFNHTAVWTGTEMIVWGGLDRSQGWDYPSIGGRYNPADDSWMAMSTTGMPERRDRHTAVWTGSEMIVWGGTIDDNLYLNTGGHYNPAGDTWAVVTTNGAPTARKWHTAVWTGSEMIVWGGIGGLNDGGRYNLLANSWTAVTTNGAPVKRGAHTAVWTGSEMIVWGGNNVDTGSLNDGGRYNPTGNNWTAVSNLGTPAARSLHTVVWTGSEMIIWGGYGGLIGHPNDTWTYTPGKLMYLYQRP